MNMTGIKVVIDTNVFITLFKRDGINRWMFDKILSGEWILCLTHDIFLEYWEVLERKTNVNIATTIVDFLLGHPYILLTENFVKWSLIAADPDDNKFCDCYFAASAKYLISNDKHFDVLKQIDFPAIALFTSDTIKELEYKNSGK
jgi:uncharacterized protein